MKGGKTPFQLRGNAGLGNASIAAIEKVIERETSQIASLHERFAHRCRDQLEVPLRNRASKEDWQAVYRQDRQGDSLLKEIDDAQSKVQKAQTKGKKGSDKLPGLMQSQTNAENAWRSQLPGYLQQYQQLDYARLTSVKELLTAFETLQNDLGRERMEAAERGLEACLLWEVGQELTEFISKEGFKGTGAPSRPSVQAAPPNIAVNNDFGTDPTESASLRPGQGRPRADTNASSSQSIRSNSTPQKSGGLLSAFRNGGKLDRRKSTMATAPARQTAVDDERETFGGRPSTGSRDRQQSYRSNASSTDDFGRPQPDRESGRGPSTELNSLRPGGSSSNKQSKRDSFMPSFSGLGLKRKGGEKNSTQLRDTEEDAEDGDTTFTSNATVQQAGFSDTNQPRADASRNLNAFSAMGNGSERPLSQASDATNRPMTQNMGDRSPMGTDGFQVSNTAAMEDCHLAKLMFYAVRTYICSGRCPRLLRTACRLQQARLGHRGC